MASSLRTALRVAPRTFTRPPTTTTSRILPLAAQRHASTISPRPATDAKSAHEAEQGSEDLEDVNLNGNYPDPSLTSALPLKRQHRDPHADWWDKQERRNYGEPVHEDNDILGIFSPDEYTHFKPGWGLVLWGCFVSAVGLLAGTVYQYYPDMPSVPRNFPDGLEAELGGPKAIRARKEGDVFP